MRVQVICRARWSLIAAQSSEAALFASGSVKGKQVRMVSWECGDGGGVSVRLKPSDDNPNRGATMVVR